MGNGISHFYLFRGFYSRDNIAHIAGVQHIPGFLFQPENTNFVCIILFARVDKFNPVTFFYLAIKYPKVSNNSSKRIKYRIENQCL